MSDSQKTYWSDKETHIGQSLTFASHSTEQETSLPQAAFLCHEIRNVKLKLLYVYKTPADEEFQAWFECNFFLFLKWFWAKSF